MAKLDVYLRHMKELGASDLHLIGSLSPRLRRRGKLEAIPGVAALEERQLAGVLREITTEAQWSEFEQGLELDFAYGLPGVARFRANYFHQQHGIAAVFRLVPDEIKSSSELGLPAAVERFAHLRSGLVLVTGPTGSGKSTTLAAIIDLINENYEKHIITIEDPIEFVHRNKRSLLSQREVGTHTADFAGALRAAIRQNPDVILVGEMRGQEAELAILAAEMGALVFGTLHTNNAIKTIDRVIDLFPVERQDQVRISLAEALAGVVSQLLLPTADGSGRVAALEILVRTSGLSNIIREGNTGQLPNLIQGGRRLGMCTMDESLENLVRAGRVSPKDAYQRASDKSAFEAYL